MGNRFCIGLILFFLFPIFILSSCQKSRPAAAKAEMPLFVLQETPESLLAFRATWMLDAGTLKVDAHPSFTLKGVGGTDVPQLYWDGGPQVYIFTEREGKPAVMNHGTALQAIAVPRTGLPPGAMAPVFYASGNRRYVAYGVGNNLGIVETGPDGVKKRFFPAPEASGELVPLFLAEREGRLVVLTVLNKPTAAEKLFLVRIDAAGKAAWVPVAKKGDPHCSFLADAAVKVGLSGQRLYLESPCGGEIQSLSLEDEKPQLVSEESLMRELKAVKIKNAPTEGEVRSSFGAYRGLLLVSTLTGGVQGRGDEIKWLLVFKEGRLLGKMAVRLGSGEATVYANGATKHYRLPPRAARLLYPAEW